MWKWEWICWWVNLISKHPADRVRRYRRLIERLTKEADIDGQWWSIFRTYPKEPVASSVAVNSAKPAENSIAIVMQGPVVTRDDLTLQTIQLYRQSMPTLPLIVSTWDSLQPDLKSAIESLGATVVTGALPSDPGPHSLNYQIASTHRGLLAAKEAGCRHVLKTRTDNRIHLADPCQFMMSLLENFPVAETANQKMRFVVADFATRLYVPYHPSDMLMFGDVDDMIQYWDATLCEPGMRFQVRDQYAEMLAEPTPEVVLCRRYLQRMNEPVEGTLADWWKVLAERFVVIDRAMLDWFWPKYDYHVGHRLETTVDIGNMATCHFAQWLQIYHGSLVPGVEVEQLKMLKVNQPLSTQMDAP